MGLDIGGWFKRITTLPKAKNSLSDVLGADKALIVKNAVGTVLQREIGAALSKVEAGIPTHEIVTRVMSAIHHALGGYVPPLILSDIEAEVERAIPNFTPHAPSLAILQIQKAVVKLLGLS